ncbi:MAG: DsrE family protein [Bacillota bacterium]
MNNNLAVLWTSGDIEVAKKMVFMYVFNAKKQNWFENVTFIVWGPSSRLLSENKSLQEEIKKFIKVDIKVEACKACSDEYGVSEKLEDLGIEVKYMGKPLSDYLKDDMKVLTI